MDITKLLEDSDPLIAAAELHERFPRKVQNVLNMAALSLDQKKRMQGRQNPVKCQAMSLAHLLWSSIVKRIYCTFK